MPCTDEKGKKIKKGQHVFVLGKCLFCDRLLEEILKEKQNEN